MRILPLLVALPACALPRMHADVFLERTLAPKAAFDLTCSQAALRYTDLGGRDFHEADGQPLVLVGDQQYVLDRQLGAQQGVTGCGRQASYAYVRGVWVGSGLTNVLDSSSR